MKDDMKKGTTIPQDLKVLLETVDEIEPMVMDKAVFDNSILELFINPDLGIDVDARWEHMKNIWINYYKESKLKASSDNILKTYDFKGKDTIVPNTALSTPIRIVDANGETVCVTPALVSYPRIKNSSDLLLDYKNNSLANNTLARTEFKKNIDKAMNERVPSHPWKDFIDEYTKDIDTSKSKEESKGNSLLEEW